MSAETFVEAEIWTVAQTDQGNVVLVRPKGSDLAVPIFIGQLETQSILIGMGKVEVPRPLTHDLAVSLVRALGAEVSRVEINDLREGTFYARILLAEGSEERIVDARPSDAIGMAVRTGCPVFIAESVVEEAGISVNLVSGEQAPALAPEGTPEAGMARPPLVLSQKDEVTRLKERLEEAIAAEDYERAAMIRDRLKLLES
jgi:bifunctional DNase/RNase